MKDNMTVTEIREAFKEIATKADFGDETARYFMDRLMKVFNEQSNPHEWCDWSEQDYGGGLPVLVDIVDDNYPDVCIGYSEHGLHKADAGVFSDEWERLTPDLTRKGQWKVSADHPLDEMPEGLHPDSVIAVKFNGGLRIISRASGIVWSNVSEFAVLEPAGVE